MEKSLAPSQKVVTHRDSKGIKFFSIVEAAYDKARLSEEEAQRVNDTPGLAELIGNFIAESRATNKYASEEVKSNYVYPKEYKGPKPISEQINILARILELDPIQALEYAKNLPQLPEGAEGWFAVPSVDALVKKYFPEVTDPADKYCRAVQLVHQKIAESRSFYNYREGQITPAQLRVSARTAHSLNLIAEKQPGSDILIIAAQLGIGHRGRSVRRAREVFVVNEFGLNSLSGNSILLVHPERLVRWEDLGMDYPGDEFAPETDGDFSEAPGVDFSDGRVGFGTVLVGDPDGHFGSASGFLPQG